MAKYDYQGSVHYYKKRKNDNGGWGWLLLAGIVIFLLAVAA